MKWYNLISFAVLAGLVIAKAQDTAPGIDTVGWAIVAVAFALLVFLTIRLSSLLVRKWPNVFTEDRAEFLSIVAIVLAASIGLYLAWGVLGEQIASHFGTLSSGGR